MESSARPITTPVVTVSPVWQTAFPEAHVGVLLLDKVTNGPPSAELRRYVADIEGKLHGRYRGADRATLLNLPTARAYQLHFRAFGQTYHVLRQLESVVLKAKPIDSPSGLVLAMFGIELDTLMLTAGHDADTLQLPLVIDRSTADEHFVGIGGREHTLRGGDMLMRDQAGIISAVIYGPDERTRMTDTTRRVLLTTYGPAGISVNKLHHHLRRLADAMRIASPSAEVQLQAVYPD
jgi:DNA/RNA-binding domain of Phe-tRNA-synthetase-like protein